MKSWDDHKSLLRWYNSVTHDQEISGVLISSALLQQPDFKKFTHFNLWRLRMSIRSLSNISDTEDIENDRYILLHMRGKLLEDFITYITLVDRCDGFDDVKY